MEVERLEAIFTAQTQQAEAAFVLLYRKLDNLENKLHSMSGFDDLERKQKRAGQSTQWFGSMVGNLAAMLTTQLTSSMLSGGEAVFNYTASLEQTRIGFDTLLGSADETDKLLKQLQKTAADTPFEFEQLTKGTQRFLNMGVAAKDVIPIMTAVGDAVAAAGGNSETIDRVTLAISQMSAKGKVSAEEINQLAEAGVGGWRILSDQLGKTQAEVIKLAEQGQISSDVFIEAFKRFSEQNFAGAMEKQAKTFNGALSTIKDNLLLTSSTAFEPFYKKISEITVRVAEQTKGADFSGVVEALIQGIGSASVQASVGLGKAFFNNFTEGIKSGDPEKIANALFFGSGTFTKSLGLGIALELVDAIEYAIGTSLRHSNLNTRNIFGNDPFADLSFESAKSGAGNLEKLKGTLDGIIGKLREVGGQSAYAETQQKLLLTSTDALTTAYGLYALKLAAVLDYQKKYKERLEFQSDIDDRVANNLTQATNNINSYMDSIRNRFNEAVSVRDTGEGLSELAKFEAMLKQLGSTGNISEEQISSFKTEITNLDVVLSQIVNNKKVERAAEDYKAFSDNIIGSLVELNRATVRSLRTGDQNAFTDLMDSLVNLTSGKINTNAFSEFAESVLNGKVSVDLLRIALRDLTPTLKETEFARIQEQLTTLILGTKELDELQKRTAANNAYKSLYEQLSNELNRFIPVSEKTRTELKLQGDEYKNLTDKQKEFLISLAQQVDRQEEVAKFQEQMRSVAQGLGSILDNSLTNLRERGWKGFLQGLLDDFTRLLQDLFIRWITSEIFKALTNPQASAGAAGGGGGGFWRGLLGALFGGLLGGIGGGIGGTGTGSVATAGGAALGRAGGGVFEAHRNYIFGEGGPELVRFGQSGRVYNNTETNRILNSRGGDIVNINFSQRIEAPRGLIPPKSARQTSEHALSGVSKALKGRDRKR